MTQSETILRAMARLRRAHSRKVAAETGIKPDSATVVLRRLTIAGRLRIVGFDMAACFRRHKPYIYEIVQT